MSESFSFTYQNLIDKTLELIKSKYRNIDSIDANVTPTIYFSNNSSYTARSLGKWSDSGSTAQGRSQDMYNPVTMTASLTSKTNPAVVSSSDVATYLQQNVRTICNAINLDSEVTAKGLLAYSGFISWFLKQGTFTLQYLNNSTASGAPCLKLPTNTYDGIKRGEDNLIKKEDFEALVLVMSGVSTVIGANLAGTNWQFTTTVCSSSCSSSSSSSCSSSCSSSSCSSSSCSSSSSCIFIAYMALTR